jgi:hypothetical protein
MPGTSGSPSAFEADSPVAAADPPLVLREVPSGGPRVFNFVDLAADPEAPPAATAVVRPVEDGSVELQGLWTAAPVPTAIVVRRFVAELADVLRTSGCRRLLVTVRSDDVEGLAAFRQGGFGPTAAQSRSAGVVRLELAL